MCGCLVAKWFAMGCGDSKYLKPDMPVKALSDAVLFHSLTISCLNMPFGVKIEYACISPCSSRNVIDICHLAHC